MAHANETASRLFYSEWILNEVLSPGSKMLDRLVGFKKLTPIPGFGRLRYTTAELAPISGMEVQFLTKGGKDE